jgi:hypothetical protein
MRDLHSVEYIVTDLLKALSYAARKPFLLGNCMVTHLDNNRGAVFSVVVLRSLLRIVH